MNRCPQSDNPTADGAATAGEPVLVTLADVKPVCRDPLTDAHAHAMRANAWADIMDLSEKLQRLDATIEFAMLRWPTVGTPIERARASRRIIALETKRMTAVVRRCQAKRRLAKTEALLRGEPARETSGLNTVWYGLGYIHADEYEQGYIQRRYKSMRAFVHSQWCREQKVAEAIERRQKIAADDGRARAQREQNFGPARTKRKRLP